MPVEFEKAFRTLTDAAGPFPWQQALYEQFLEGNIPASCQVPTGLGKTAVIAIWLIALANRPDRMPRRLVYVVNRRTVVDQTTEEVAKYRKNLAAAGLEELLKEMCAFRTDVPLAISTLRGQFADNREWSVDPARPGVIAGTVDMIGSRLLFAGYGIGFKLRPLHAGFLGQDALLIHDEAHLEPAFQDLLAAIVEEQRRSGDLKPLRVLELTATSRSQNSPFRLTDEERSPPRSFPIDSAAPIHCVWRRLRAAKRINFHRNADEKKLAEQVADLALEKFKDRESTVLIYLRKVEDVERTVEKLRRAKQQDVQQLTGTLRGLERDHLIDHPVFQRFLPNAKRQPRAGYLVCTSAGEVGVNISADHLICDLSTFESMAQRFGRVNRFGDRSDSEIHVVHPIQLDPDNSMDGRRSKTLELLRQLDGDGSPAALDQLDIQKRLDAFAPSPTVLPVSDILFDRWALTTIREALPGRPPVEPYLHGLSEFSPPETHIAWREEVAIIKDDLVDLYKPEELLDDYPLKPQELLRDVTRRVHERLKRLRAMDDTPLWVVSSDNAIEVTTLGRIREARPEEIAYKTLLLPPSAGGLEEGMLSATSDAADDVADEWRDENGQRRRTRHWEGKPSNGEMKQMRLVRRIDFRAGRDDEDNEELDRPRYWLWFVRPGKADNESSKVAAKIITLDAHTNDVAKRATAIAQALQFPADIRTAFLVAAKNHDLGKSRPVWQRSIGNRDWTKCLAKSNGAKTTIEISNYRHEFGSLLDLHRNTEFHSLSPEIQDLALHLIAAHHGRARPNFRHDEAFDPETDQEEGTLAAVEAAQRYAQLQKKYGRWGLAYLESLLRAADYAASAEPSDDDEEIQ